MGFFTLGMETIQSQAKHKSPLKLSSIILPTITTSLSQLEAKIFFGWKFLKTKQPKLIKIIPSIFWNQLKTKPNKKPFFKTLNVLLKFSTMITNSMFWLQINLSFIRTINPKLRKSMKLLTQLHLFQQKLA